MEYGLIMAQRQREPEASLSELRNLHKLFCGDCKINVYPEIQFCYGKPVDICPECSGTDLGDAK